ncbi:MAG TPA: hypothetical protein VGD56_12475, partial [Gemmatirosa sp.]
MTALAPTPTPAAAPAAPVLSPLLAWLVGRAEAAPDALANAAAAAPDAVRPAADDPELLARAFAATGAPFAALRVVGAALPPREGIWWAWVAVRHTLQTLAERGPAAPPAAAHAALAAVERWISEPTDANRRAAWAAGQAADLTTPAGCLCGAVFFTGGSIAAPQSPMAVPPPPGAHVTMAASAVLMAAAQLDPARLTDLVGASVAQAAVVANRLGGWLPAATA